MGLRGEWRDRYYRDGALVRDTGWVPNQVQNLAATIVAGLLCRARERAPFDAPVFNGVTYMAVGSGLAAWDAAAAVQPRTDTSLENETFRKAVAPADLAFLDPDDGVTVVAGPTRMFQVEVTLEQNEANGTLREFALYGGQATGVAESGLIMNWVVHPRIDKDNTITISRLVRVEILLP